MKMQSCLYTLLLVLFSCMASPALAKEVTQQYKGVTLNAGLELAPGHSLHDGVILITHGALEDRGMAFVQYLQGLLNDDGYNTLAINLSLGISNRHGPYDCRIAQRHHNQDAADEIGVWVKWLKQRGVERVILLGHSRGGAQTALYAAQNHDSAVKAVVLMAPARGENTSPAEYQKRYGKALAPVLKKARSLLRAGKSETILHHIGLLTCRDTSASASSFVSYYGQSPALDTPTLLPKIKPPVLVLVAGDDKVVTHLDNYVAPLVDGKHLQMKIIDGASHLFRDLYTDDAVDAINEFLEKI